MIETKVIMALMSMQFVTQTEYEELDAKGRSHRLRTTPEGERAYQVRVVTAKPVDGMPVRDTIRSSF